MYIQVSEYYQNYFLIILKYVYKYHYFYILYLISACILVE